MRRYKLSAVLLIRDEGEYLPEWLAWHLGQGVEHFYLYDDSREGPIRSYLGEYDSYCTVRDAVRYRFHLQLEAYLDALRRFGGETEWMAFLDTDEFLRVTDGGTLPGLLEELPGPAAVLAPWVVYNADGQILKKPGSVRERFRRTVPWLRGMPHWKSIVRPEQVISMAAHHPARLKPGAYMADTSGARRDTDFSGLPADRLVVDHYYTKSYEEWLDRLPKGSCDPFSARRMSWFEELNPGLLARAGLSLGERPDASKKGVNTYE